MSTNSLTERVTKEAILTAGTRTVLRSPLLARMRDNQRKPLLSDQGFDIAASIGVDCRIVLPQLGWTETWIQFDPAEVDPADADIVFLKLVQGSDEISAPVQNGPYADFEAFIADIIAEVEAEILAEGATGTVSAIDLDGDDIAETIKISLEGEWTWDELTTEGCGDWSLWVTPDAASARVWTRSGAVLGVNAPPVIGGSVNGWALAADLGDVSESFDERLALPGRIGGWVELYGVSYLPAELNDEPPGLPNSGLESLTPNAGTVTLLPLLFVALLPAVTP